MIKAWLDFTTVKRQSARPLGRFFPYDRNFVLCSAQNRSICQQAAPLLRGGLPVRMKKMMKMKKMNAIL